MEGRQKGKRGRGRPRQKLMDCMDDGGRIPGTQGKGKTSRRVESLDPWICREADYLKKNPV